jgi:hypothetical protein
MTSRSAFRFVVTLALVFAVAGAYGIFTAKASMKSASSVLGVRGAPSTVSGVETPRRVRVAQGESFASLPVGTFTLIDGAAITCPSGTCSYGGDNNQQVQASATSNIAILTSVDGTFIGVGPYLGPVSTDFEAKQWSDFASGYAPGSHLVQTWVYMRDAAATAYWYNFKYTIYTP